MYNITLTTEDNMTFLFIILAILAILVMIWWAYKEGEKRAMKRIEDGARARAHVRYTDRVKHDSEKEDKHPLAGFHVVEIEDLFNEFGDLTETQQKIIDKIMSDSNARVTVCSLNHVCNKNCIGICL